MTRVELLTRPGCHLCDAARETVLREAAAAGIEVRETNIDDDAELTRRYGEEIPVVLIDGRVHTYWRVDAGRFRAALEGLDVSGGRA
ncbi:glutaredoxin family protein [Spelaeicoccus albus]|uniref:Glutaredoxin n=1 Tax=Spelaeicoccus albus TaxID=1280376 RepID=A0A7Z0D5Q7_9MICO|nr:glutaredoxin family protein [Spelaeicoccus albus]NYI69392.1 glutaredoxin [Spelaeicoccus albus]